MPETSTLEVASRYSAAMAAQDSETMHSLHSQDFVLDFIYRDAFESGLLSAEETMQFWPAWFAGFIAATILVGIVPTALLLVFAFLRFWGGEPLRTAAVVAVIFAAIVYVTFEMALGVPLFAGMLRGGL